MTAGEPRKYEGRTRDRSKKKGKRVQMCFIKRKIDTCSSSWSVYVCYVIVLFANIKMWLIEKYKVLYKYNIT